jgi:membrane protein insertase Oxa1/YidC/SpoIIIJ
MGLLLATRWTLVGSAPSVTRGRNQFVMIYMALHLLAAVAYVFMGLTGLSQQNTLSLMMFVMPVLILFALVLSTAGLRSVRSLSFT